MESRVFRWACLVLAAIAAGLALWMLNDMRQEVKRTNEMVGERLPAILENVQQGTATLARVSQDIDALRDLGGFGDLGKDKSLIVYADDVLDFLEAQPGQIGLPKVIGGGVKDLVPAAEWAHGARKEALWLTVLASTKAELLDRLSKNKFGSAWLYVPPGGAPIALADFLKQQHAASKGL